MTADNFPVRPIVRGTTSPGAYPAELIDNDVLPWFLFLDALAYISASSGLSLFAYRYDLWPLLGLSYTAGINSYMEVELYTAAGLWEVSFPVDTRNDYPIVQYSIDGTNIGATFDRYAATPGLLMHTPTPAGGTLLTRGKHTFRMTATSKNASSSNYVLVYSGILLSRRS